DFVPRHAPVFLGDEKKFLADCVDSTFVSTVGPFVGQFEEQGAAYTGAHYAISTVNGTSALHAAMQLVGVVPGSEVISQTLSFVATANAISYCGAFPVFLDSDQRNLGLCPKQLEMFLRDDCHSVNGVLINKKTNRKVSACVPVHIFGHA